MPAFDLDEALDTLYPGQNRRKARFESSCEYQAQLSIAALAAKDPACQSHIPFIRNALDKGMYKLAQKYLVNAMREAWAQERMEDLYTLSLIGKQLRRHVQADINEKAGIPEHKDIFGILHRLEIFQEALDDFAALMRNRDGSPQPFAGKELASRWSNETDRYPIITQTEQALLYKIEFWSHLAFQNYTEAEAVQERLVDLCLRAPADRLRRKAIKELGILIRMYHHNHKYTQAETASLRMMGIEAYSPEDELIRTKSRIKTGFMAAMGTGNVDRGREALRELKKFELQIPEDSRPNLYIYAILFCAFLGQWSNLLHWSNRFHSLPLKQRSRFAWQVHLVQAIAAIELQDMELANTFLTRMRRAARTKDFDLPKLAYRSLQRIINALPKETSFLTARFRSELNELMNVPAERSSAMFFDVRLWLEARQRNISIYEVAQAEEFRSFREYFAVQA